MMRFAHYNPVRVVFGAWEADRLDRVSAENLAMEGLR